MGRPKNALFYEAALQRTFGCRDSIDQPFAGHQMMKCSLVVICCSLLQAVSAGGSSGVVVQTNDGPVEGNRGDNGVTVFHHLPFAAAPVGQLRFRPPTRPTPWTKTRKAFRVGPVCPQLDLVKFEHLGQEDCLSLSVYVPASCTSGSPCPVMQWIHGGAWIEGSNYGITGNYDGSHLASKYDMIIVAGNYRLDSLGWIALEELQGESADGSFG